MTMATGRRVIAAAVLAAAMSSLACREGVKADAARATAVAVLKDAIRTAPDDITLAHNLARLLLDAADPSVRDPGLTQSLAEEICYRTRNQDPRALQTLAVAHAANGQRELARQAAIREVSVARHSGDRDAATDLQELSERLDH